MTDKLLSEVTDDDIERARQAIEDELIELREAGIGILGRGNGLHVNYKDGSPSPVMRMATPDAIRMAIKVILDSRDGKV